MGVTKQMKVTIIVLGAIILALVVRVGYLYYYSFILKKGFQFEMLMDLLILFLFCSQLATSIEQYKFYNKEMKGGN